MLRCPAPLKTGCLLSVLPEILLCLAMPCSAQHALDEKPLHINALAPLEAELLAPLNAGSLVRGAPVLSKARLDWMGPTCVLRVGALVSGHIVDFEPRSKQNKGSSITILFDHANCGGHLTPIGFTLVALIVTPELDEGSPLLDAGFANGPAAQTTPGFANNIPQARPDLNNAMTGRVGGNGANGLGHIAAGSVIGLNKVTLSVGTGPEGSSVLTAVKGNIRLERATQLVLIPMPAAVSSGDVPAVMARAESPGLPTPSTLIAALIPEVAAPPEIDETEICTAPCNVVPSTISHELPRASATLSAARFGYVPHDHREYETFDHESTLMYLDSENLLFTFDPHSLRQRYASGLSSESMRTVRAVLLNPKTLAIKRVREWQVQGEGQYVWRAGPGQILVHLGHELRLLGPDLDVIRSLPMSGPLQFVSVSPSGNRIAVGVLHERYSPAMHDVLVTALHMEPEEDVDIQLVDHDFNVLLTARQSSALRAPILSDDGEIRINWTGKSNHWRISEYRWDHTTRTVATTISGCRPNVSTPLPKLLFLVGCSYPQFQNWYRVLRLDGHSILQGRGSPHEIEQASNSSTQGEFVVRVVRFMRPLANGERFHKEDLREQEFSIYRATDGTRLFLTTTPDVSLVEQSFALSPGGDQLAVITDARISFYPIEEPTD